MKLALGTVQFGLNYGIANQTGQVPPQEVASIIELAREAGIGMLDTAIAYGESEARLGACGVNDFRVVSKLPSSVGVPDIAGMVELSLERLGVTSLYGILLHRSEDLAGPDGARIYAGLCDLKLRGLANKIGVSIYDPQELDLLADRFKFDIVQAPYNIVDRRLETSGWLSRLKGDDIEVHTRSAFLQGLLLMKPGQRPERFSRWTALWSGWDSWLSETQTSALQGALGFVLGNGAVDQVVVGVDSKVQLVDILGAAGTSVDPAPAWLANGDPDLINPSRWNSL